jgi:glucose-1-phosphate thymidylyltransferase
MSQFCLEAILETGITEIAIIIGGVGSNKVREYYEDGKRFGAKITYIEQDEPRGIAHAIRLCKEFVNNEKFLVFLGDNIIQKSIIEFVENFNSSDYDATVLLCEVDNPSRFGIADIDNNKIVKITEKPKNPTSNLAVTGIYLLTPRIELEITDALDNLLKQNNNISFEKITDYWKDTGTPEDIIHANGEIIKKTLEQSKKNKNEHLIGMDSIVESNVEIIEPVVIGKNCHISTGSSIGPNVSVGDNTTISVSSIENSIIMQNCNL